MTQKWESWILPIAMVVGIAGEQVLRHLTPLLPPMIFLMLFFTFCKVNPAKMRFRAWHGWLLGIQLVLSVGSYYLAYTLLPEEYRDAVAQGLMLCFMMPTATAAPIIASKLGGDILDLTALTMLSNLVTVIVVPTFFPVIYTAAHIEFWSAAWLILRKVGPLLLGPLLAAWALRAGWNRYYQHRGQREFHLSHHLVQMPFYIWAGTLLILTAEVTHTLINESYHPMTLILQATGAMVACAIQFGTGHLLGKQDLGTRVTAGQAFGQKNTTLGVWLAQTYLLPLSAIGPAFYIVWQNLYNSWQLRQSQRMHEATTKT